MPTTTPAKPRWLCLLAAFAGLLCIAAALLFPTKSLQQRGWTEEDASKLARLSSEYHRSNYRSPAEMGLTEQQYDKQREQLLRSTEALDQKLQDAIEGPKNLKSLLLWIGVALAIGGAAGTRFVTG